MHLQYPLVDIAKVQIEKPPKLLTSSRFEVRLPISGRQGCSSTALHGIFRPNDYQARVTFHDCDQVLIYLSGSGNVGIDNQYIKVRAGHCLYVPRGTEYSFYNSAGDKVEIVSFIIGASDFEKIYYESSSEQAFDESVPLVAELNQGALVHLDDVQPENMDRGDGWLISDFRLPIAKHNGSSSTLFRARFLPGAVHKKHCHRDCEEIYYIISGRGLAGAGDDRVEVHGGQFHYIPKGVEHWLYNLSDTEAIEVVGIYINAGSVAETGYVYLGDVSQDDLQVEYNKP